MRDGRTRKLATEETEGLGARYLAQWQITIVVESGGEDGVEYDIATDHVTLGRGPGVDLPFDDDAMSREHAILEFTSEGFRVRDLGSMNGITLNGGAVQTADLKHGDRFLLGQHVFRFLVEERPRRTPTYALPDA